MIRRILFAVLPLLFSLVTTAEAELTPDEVAVIAMARSQQSRHLADYYVGARGIPKSQICLLSAKPGTTMTREVWQQESRPEIYAWLAENDLRTKIRCFVTLWDVPLKIERQPAGSPVSASRKNYLSQSRQGAVGQFAELVQMLHALGNDDRPPRPELPGDASLVDLVKLFDTELTAARNRANELETQDEKKRAGAVLERAFMAGSGLAGLLRSVAQRDNLDKLPPETIARVARFRGQLAGLGDGIQALNALPGSVARDIQMLGIVQKTGGLVGVIQWIDQQLTLLEKNETYASFDSELSLLHWPEYPLAQWLPNLNHYRWGNLPNRRRATVMVSRLEAPSVELVQNLIDTAIATEKSGLAGKVYLDSRGVSFDPASGKRGSYGQYDQSLRDLADRLTGHTKLQVVLNEEATLFQPGDCPEAALYCGWYSLAKYVDAFDFTAGAVGYHMASSEASTLRRPGSKLWCIAMLEDGIGATLGPVYEPYLGAFQLPDEFFSLLLTGRYTLAEAYYRTKPYNSWVMVLIGDPLYNPFKNNPALSMEHLPEKLRGDPPAAAATPDSE